MSSAFPSSSWKAERSTCGTRYKYMFYMAIAVICVMSFSTMKSLDSINALKAKINRIDNNDDLSLRFGNRVLQKAEELRFFSQKEEKNDVDNPKFVLVTGERTTPCKTSLGTNIMMKTYKNKVDYCNFHNCRVWYALESWQEGLVGSWARYPILLKLMKSNPSIEWFMWMDADAIFTDFNFSIPFHDYNSWNKKMVVPGFWEKVYSENPDWIALNAGVFLMRNCEWTHRFMEKWIVLGDPKNAGMAKQKINTLIKSRPQAWEADDQSALVYLLNQNRTESEVHVFLEARYSLHGFWSFIVDKYELMLQGKKAVPFVTHFCGCNFCGHTEITRDCSVGFQRAFNFADNQLLSIGGLRHVNLTLYDVEPVTTSSSLSL